MLAGLTAILFSFAFQDNNSLSQKLNDKDREIREEKRISESLRDDVQRAERDKAELKAAADRERAERERRERELRSREGTESNEMAALRSEINRVLEEKRSLTITLDGQRGEINKLQDELRAKQKKLDDLKEEVDDLKAEVRDKDEEVDKLKSELEEREQEAQRLKYHVEEHSDKVEKLREELTIKTGELNERERADKTEVGKENLLQQKTTKLEKMVRDMHVELNVKKQSLKKAIKQSEQVRITSPALLTANLTCSLRAIRLLITVHHRKRWRSAGSRTRLRTSRDSWKKWKVERRTPATTKATATAKRTTAKRRRKSRRRAATTTMMTMTKMKTRTTARISRRRSRSSRLKKARGFILSYPLSKADCRTAMLISPISPFQMCSSSVWRRWMLWRRRSWL
jgi:myosin heavy subunit